MWNWCELFSEDLEKSDIFSLAFPKAELYLDAGYRILPSLALALSIPRKVCVDSLKLSKGELSKDEMSTLFTVFELCECGFEMDSKKLFDLFELIVPLPKKPRKIYNK